MRISNNINIISGIKVKSHIFSRGEFIAGI